MKLLSRESRVEGRKRERGLALVGSCSRHSTLARQRPRGAFTLLEVIIACAIFFLVAFSILEMVTRSLAAAKALQKHEPDPAIVLHSQTMSNMFEEGTMSGTFEDIAPGMYPGYRWEAEFREVESNGLWRIHVFSYNQRNPRQTPAEAVTLVWCPFCKPGSASKPQP